MPANPLCPGCNVELRKPFACWSCDWRAPALFATDDPERGNSASARRIVTAPPPRWTREQWLENQRRCQPIIDRIKVQLKAAEAKHRGSAMPHILSGAVLAGISYDPEAVAEREAIQHELEERGPHDH